MFLVWDLFLPWALLRCCYDLPLRRTLVRSVILFSLAENKKSWHVQLLDVKI